ncbi:unnamed protein product [Timema podura]|uniref:Uncharacterized protein n=1 Tax=Timema podura TaxID=61482 RepID=A0ABN7NZW1_TIMPD|nr:unnamed protein product [Timema podura]
MIVEAGSWNWRSVSSFPPKVFGSGQLCDVCWPARLSMLGAVESTSCARISGPGMFTLELAAYGISRIGLLQLGYLPTIPLLKLLDEYGLGGEYSSMQASYCNRGAKELIPLKPGDLI